MNDFSSAIRKMLSRKGIRVLSATLAPGEDGSFANAIHVYNVDDNGTHRVWPHIRVVAEATAA